MDDKNNPRLRMGGLIEQEFCAYWNAEMKAAGVTAPVAIFQPTAKARGGLALVLPSEAIIILSKLGEAAAEAIGAGIGKLLWDRLKKFFQKTPPDKIPKTIVIIINETKVVLDPRELPDTPPADFLDLFHR
ncbi:MAG: hypothetical protein LV479_01870 [Methylacidiphilales bacterium]|nr:hypothetical protein [Candidatus Methylacidiphilales bacterium]